MSTISAGLVKVGNLNVSSASTSGVTATTATIGTLNATNVNASNLDFSNLEISGDLSVNGETALSNVTVAGNSIVDRIMDGNIPSIRLLNAIQQTLRIKPDWFQNTRMYQIYTKSFKGTDSTKAYGTLK